MNIKLDFLGIFNLDNEGSYKQEFFSSVTYIFGDNNVGKTVLSKIPAFTLGANIKLEDLDISYKNFLTVLSLNISTKIYYFIRINSKKYDYDLYIFDCNFKNIFKGKANSHNKLNTLDYNKKIYELFSIEYILCKKTIEKMPVFTTPHIGTILEFFNIFEANWGKDWKSFQKDIFKIKVKDLMYTFLYLTEEISDEDAKKMLNQENLSKNIKRNKEELKNLDYLLNSLNELTLSKQDIEELKNSNDFNNKILKEISSNEIILRKKMNNKKDINSDIAKLNLIIGQVENNLENIDKFNKEYEYFYQDVTIHEEYTKKIYLKDIVDFKIRTNENIYKLEEVKLKLEQEENSLNEINKSINFLEKENRNLYSSLIKIQDKYFQINKKNIDNNIKQIIINYQIKKDNIIFLLKDQEINNKKIKDQIKVFDENLKKIEETYKSKLDENIDLLHLNYNVHYSDFISNRESTGAEAIIYSLAKLYIYFTYITKINFFYIIDSLKDKDQDPNTVKAREVLIKNFIEKNRDLNKQIIIFSSNAETLDIDNNDDSIMQFKIERKPESLMEFSDNNFNLWLKNNILDKLS